MGFEDRSAIEKKMSSAVTDFFAGLGFQIVNIGYENIFPPEIREKLRTIYNDPTVLFVRFLPDKFAYLNDKIIFLLEYKICNAPIKLQSRIDFLIEQSGVKTLNKKNVAAIETSSVENYRKISSLGVKILLVIYSDFHGRPFVAEWFNKVKVFFQDNVKLGEGNASRTPYSDVNLDDFIDLQDFMVKEFGLTKEKVSEQYKICLTKIRG